MALILVFHNQAPAGEPLPEVCDYTVQVLINELLIVEGKVEGHARADGYVPLVQKWLDQENARARSVPRRVISRKAGVK